MINSNTELKSAFVSLHLREMFRFEAEGVFNLEQHLRSLTWTLDESRVRLEAVYTTSDVIVRHLKDLEWQTDETTAAFERAGVQTRASLEEAARAAERDYGMIRASGAATAEGLAAAHARMVEAQRAAGQQTGSAASA